GGAPLVLLALPAADPLQVLRELLEVFPAARAPLLAPLELRQLARDVVLLRDHALLDLDDCVPPLPQLGLQVGTQLDRILPRLDPSLPPRRLGVARGLLEHLRPLTPCRIEARAGVPAESGDGRAGAGGESE